MTTCPICPLCGRRMTSATLLATNERTWLCINVNCEDCASEELEAQGLEPAHPTALARLIAAGTVWIEDSAIVGRASDGIAVQIGTVDTMEATERYLADHPNPSDW